MIVKFFSVMMSVMITLLSPLGIVFKAPEGETIDNVIIMIGDGMGWNHLYATQEKYNLELDMLTKTDYHGSSKHALQAMKLPILLQAALHFQQVHAQKTGMSEFICSTPMR